MLGHSSSDTLDLTSLGSEARGRREEQFSSSVGDMVVSLEDFLGDPTVRRQLKLDVTRRITSILDDPEQTQRFATDSSGQPAKALGSGSSSDSSSPEDKVRDAFKVLEENLPAHVQKAVGAILRGDMQIQETGPDTGTPVPVLTANTKVKDVEEERNKLQSALNKVASALGVGSVTGESPDRYHSRVVDEVQKTKAKADAPATPAVAADVIKKDDMKSTLDKLGKAVKGEKTSAMKGSTIEGHDAVVSAFNEAADKVGADKLS